MEKYNNVRMCECADVRMIDRTYFILSYNLIEKRYIWKDWLILGKLIRTYVH